MNDYDLYGIKVGMNDAIMASADNLNMVWYVSSVIENNSYTCLITFNKTSCYFVYSTIVPISNLSIIIYNCINQQGENVIGFLQSNSTCPFNLVNEQIVSNYSTQDNYIIGIDGSNFGVYGFADDFIFYYQLNSSYSLTIWSNQLGMSPRAIDIGSNLAYGIIVGYCQTTPSTAIECAFTLSLNQSLSCPTIFNQFSIFGYTQFPYSDPRTNHHISNSQVYNEQFSLSVSINWLNRRVLIGIPSLNIVLLYSIDNISTALGVRDNGIGYMGYGKSVAWLDNQGKKAVILTNYYVYSTYQWIISTFHVYDIESDGLTDNTQPILIYPNSEQIIYPWINPSLIRLVCSYFGAVTIFDILGNPAIILSSPPGYYPDTNSSSYTSINVPCIPGTYRNYSGIELCLLCPNGTYSSNCISCQSNNSFCPSGSIEDLSYLLIESIIQDEDYPESPENTVFDDLLMQNMFSLNTQSISCLFLSPLTWTFIVFTIGILIAIIMIIHELFSPNTHAMRERTKQILKKVDLIGEGEVSFYLFLIKIKYLLKVMDRWSCFISSNCSCYISICIFNKIL